MYFISRKDFIKLIVDDNFAIQLATISMIYRF